MKKTCPMCGMNGTIPAHDQYFCSEHCVKKFEEKVHKDEKSCPSCTTKPGTPWYRQKLFIITIFTILVLVVSYLIYKSEAYPYYNKFGEFVDNFIDYVALIWWAILIGFFIGGIIDYFIPREYIKKYLSRHRKRTILYSIVFGFFMSACSHGILAIAIELYKKGANTSSVVAFLLAAPWANLPITVLLFGFFGIQALLIVISALIIATTTGLIFQILERKGMVECMHCKMGEDKPILEDFSIIKDVKRRIKEYEFTRKNVKHAFVGTMQGSWALTKMVMWWLVIGMLMAAVVRTVVSHDLFIQYMGPTLFGLIVTLFFATIIEVCSEGSSPLAFEIFNQTGAFGNSFTFLMAGVATDYTEIGLIWHNIGRKAALWIPIITVPQILFLSFLFNMFV